MPTPPPAPGVKVAPPPPMPALRHLTGDGTWPFMTVTVEGEDLIVEGVSSWFGGGRDSEDNSIGASGFNSALHSDYLGLSLPQSGRGIKTMAGCPIPKLPWFSPARVWSPDTNKTAIVHLIDIGPSRATAHAVDLTPAVFEALGLSLEKGLYRVRVRLLGAAQYVKPV